MIASRCSRRDKSVPILPIELQVYDGQDNAEPGAHGAASGRIGPLLPKTNTIERLLLPLHKIPAE